MSLIDKLKTNSTIKDSNILSKSKFFNTKDLIQTSVPALNVALSGRLDGGLTPGLTVFAGPSKHFKTAFAMLMIKAYLEKYDDAVVLFYDSEFGAPQGYFDSFDIDTDRVMHTPITDIEQLKHDMMSQLNNIERGDHVIVVVDSVGNQMKSLFRMITPHLTIKDIPAVVVNHTYMEIGMFPKAIVSGGTGIYYSADNIYIIGRQQEKTGTDVTGYNFIINVEKSRYVREKSKIPIEVSFDGGISKWSGLLDMALESGHVVKPKVGWYQIAANGTDSKNYRAKETQNKDFWLPILSDKTFTDWIESRYLISTGSIMQDEVSEDDIAEAYGEDE